MVEDSSFCKEVDVDCKYYAQLEGTKHLASVIVATKGAIVVNLQISGVIYTGVLLDASHSSTIPRCVRAPQLEGKKGDQVEESTVTIEPEDCESSDASESGIISSACKFRHTYLEEENRNTNPIIIPSRSSSIAASLLRLHERRRLRERKKNPKGKVFLCSMCKTHCLDTDNSDTETAVNLTTPPIRISFKSPEGPSVMEIEPREYKKSHKRKHGSKHRSKKHLKKMKHVESEEARTDTNIQPVVSNNVNNSNTADMFSSVIDDSDDNGLVIDIPGEKASRPKRKLSGPVATPDSPSPGSSHSNHSSLPKIRTKTKARLKQQTKMKKAASSTPSASIVSEKNCRFVETYDSADGKHISVGDVIWGKIMGFPWWPGRVCAITVSENRDGIIMDHTADIDWYNSPTKSHLACSAIYPFLEDFGKRFDKKKKSKSYTQAIDEAKYEAAMNEQLAQALADATEKDKRANSPEPSSDEEQAGESNQKVPEGESNEDMNEESVGDVEQTSFNSADPDMAHDDNTESPPNAVPTEIELDIPMCEQSLASTQSEDDSSELSEDTHAVAAAHSVDESCRESPSLLTDVFLRTSEQSSNSFPTQMNEDFSLVPPHTSTSMANNTTEVVDNDDDIEDCLTISLPSPRSLLNSH